MSVITLSDYFVLTLNVYILWICRVLDW